MSVSSQNNKSIELVAPPPLKAFYVQKVFAHSKINHIRNDSRSAIVLYIGVLALSKKPLITSMPFVDVTNNESTKVISCSEQP